MLVAGATWCLFLLGYRWSLPRPLAFGWFVILMILALLFHLLMRQLGWTGFFWSTNTPFGFFANRNQMANLMAGTFLTAFALALTHRTPRWKWLFASAFLMVLLPLTLSRAGLLLAFAGALLWLFFYRPSWFRGRQLGAGLGLLMLIITGLSFNGGAAWNRLTAWFASPGSDFRVLIQLDALNLIRSQPVYGVGLGNFEYVTALGRNYAAIQSRVLHPESDWWWAAAEIGWPVTIILVFLALLLIVSSWPDKEDPERPWKLIGTIWALLFFLHGFADVSGHRIGTLWPAVLLFSLALRHRPALPYSRFLTVAMGLVLTAAGGVLYAAQQGQGPLIPQAPLVLAQAEADVKAHQLEAASQLLEAGLRRYPMNWQMHYWQGVVHLLKDHDPKAATTDFARARMLEPQAASLPLAEANLWANRGNWEAVLIDWEDCLARTQDSDEMFTTLARQTRNQPRLIAFLQHRLEGRASRWIDLLPSIWPAERGDLTVRLLRINEELRDWSPEHQAAVLKYAVQDIPQWLHEYLLAHPAFAQKQWRVSAEVAAGLGEYETAGRLIAQHLGPAPEKIPGVDWRKLKIETALNPDDQDLALLFVDALVADGQSADALEWLDRRQTQKPLNGSLANRRTRLLAGAGRWKEACQSWKQENKP